MRMVAAGAIVANALRPSITQPSPARRAVVDGRVRSCGEGSLAAAANTTSAATTPRSVRPIPAARRPSSRSTAERHDRTRLISTAKCMFTPIVVAASPRASREHATSTSWTEVTPPPPSILGTGATRKRSACSFCRCSTANVPSRSWTMAPSAKSSAKRVAASTISAPASVSARSSMLTISAAP